MHGTQRIKEINIIPFQIGFTEQHIKKVGNSERIIESRKLKIAYYLLKLNHNFTVNKQSPLTLEYTVKGISWQPTLNANILNNEKANICLEATITNNVLGLKDVSVSLISTPIENVQPKAKTNRRYNQYTPAIEYHPLDNIKYPSSLYAEYPIGSISLPVGSGNYKINNIFCKDTEIAERIYMWRTKENVIKKITYIRNPFATPLCNAEFNVYKKNIQLSSGKSNWIEPDAPLVLLTENENSITCNATVEVIENFQKRNLWRNCSSSSTPPCDSKNALFYNHQFEFSCINNSGKDITLEVVFEKKYGKHYKNIYHFLKKPTKSPSWWHIWDLNIKNKQKSIIKFNIDSDQRTYKEYKKYSKAIEGC